MVCHIGYPKILLMMEKMKHEAIVSLALASAYRSQSMMVNLWNQRGEWKGRRVRNGKVGGKEGNLRLLKAWIVHLSKRLIDDDGIPSSFTTCQGWSQPSTYTWLLSDLFKKLNECESENRRVWSAKTISIIYQYHRMEIKILESIKIIKMENSIVDKNGMQLWTTFLLPT